VNNIFYYWKLKKIKKKDIIEELDFTTDFYYDWKHLGSKFLIADQKKILQSAAYLPQ